MATNASTPAVTTPYVDDIAEDNYNLIRGFYRIRNDRQRKNKPRINFIQPDFLNIVVGPMMQHRIQRTNDDIREAVDLWFSNRAEAEERYGHISVWDTSRVTDMHELFRYKYEFNDDISRWDVSNVINMRGLFNGARAFNQAIGHWNVSNVTTMHSMFHGAESFNQAIGGWNVSNVTVMKSMFHEAESFNQAIGDWNVRNVTDMSYMFDTAHNFKQDISGWDVSNVTNHYHVFWRCYLAEEHRPVFPPSPPGTYNVGGKQSRRASRKRSRKCKRTTKRGARKTRRV